MLTWSVPPALANPTIVSQRVVAKVMLDLTIYLPGPSEHELDQLIDLYERTCPRDRLVRYKISEIEVWARVAKPVLTVRGRAAAAAGIRHPHFEPVRARIRDGRAFELQFWDARPIDDPDGSWSFDCRRMHYRSKGLFAFARFLMPLSTDPYVIRDIAREVADHVELTSGHGGMVFAYDSWWIKWAFDAIYAQSRRFWGVDIEHMKGSLPLTKQGIKGVNWLTLVGSQFASIPEIAAGLNDLSKTADLTIERFKHASVVTAGPLPVAGDQHWPDNSLGPSYAVAKALAPLFWSAHPDFPSERWMNNGNTVGWIRRFLEPDGWR